MDFQGYINNCKKNKPIRLKLVITHQNPKKKHKNNEDIPSFFRKNFLEA